MEFVICVVTYQILSSVWNQLWASKYDLILALRSQTFENLRETFNRHALGTWNRLVQKKKGGKNVSTETPVHHWPFWWPVAGGDTFILPLAPVIAPEQKNWPCHPLPLFMAVSMILNLWHSSSYCMPHSWLTQFGAFSSSLPLWCCCAGYL